MHIKPGAVMGVVILSTAAAIGRHASQTPSGVEAAPPASAQATPAPRGQAALEEEFRSQLSGAVLAGSFRMIGKGMGREEPTLSDPIPERYVIEEATKVLDDSWMIKARVQYGDKDVTLPIIVRVLWAGDTPVITLDQAAIPMIGTYSARVMVHRGFYSGTWHGAGYGGVMSGQITRWDGRDAPADKRGTKPEDAADPPAPQPREGAAAPPKP